MSEIGGLGYGDFNPFGFNIGFAVNLNQYQPKLWKSGINLILLFY